MAKKLTDNPSLLPAEEQQAMIIARNTLRWADEEIMKHGKEVIRVLSQVHKDKAWRYDYDSFEDYCHERWSIGQRRALQIIAGENFRALLAEHASKEIVDNLKEGHLRVLPKNPKKAARILNRLGKNGKEITARRIKDELNPDVLPPSFSICPHCRQPLLKKKPSSIPD